MTLSPFGLGFIGPLRLHGHHPFWSAGRRSGAESARAKTASSSSELGRLIPQLLCRFAPAGSLMTFPAAFALRQRDDRYTMKCLGFRLTGKPSQAQIFDRTRIYDRIDARQDLSLGEVRWTQPSSDHAQQEGDMNRNVIALALGLVVDPALAAGRARLIGARRFAAARGGGTSVVRWRRRRKTSNSSLNRHA